MIKFNLMYITIPIISALIGWFTNWLAVKMIFRPRKEFNFLGIKIQGLIPRRKKELAQKIAETVEKELISHKDIQAIIQSDEVMSQITSTLRSKISFFIDTVLSSNSFLKALVPGDMIQKLTDMLLQELSKQIPELMDDIFKNVENRLDFQKIICQKIEAFDLTKFESIIFAISSKELKAIEYLGGILGFIIGLIQVIILILGANNG